MPVSTALVVGASGRLGHEVVAALVRRGHAVRGAARDPARVPAPAAPVRVDLLDPVSLRAACRGVAAVVMAAGAPVSLLPTPGHPGFHAIDFRGTLRLLDVARAEGVRRFVYVSVFAPPGFDGGPYVEAHRAAADAVRASGITWAVVQPTGFFSAFDPILMLARLGVAPLIGDGEALTNPIDERDLAEVVVRAVEGEGGDLPVGGPDVLSRRAIAGAALTATGAVPRFVRIPDPILRVAPRVVGAADRRLGELLRFLDAVSRVDVVAPAAGTRRLADYFAERLRGRARGEV